jgi:preprotein translocase SecE subunit
VARDRKRARQRRQRGGSAAARGSKTVEAQAPSQPVRGDLPGSLDHASGEVDEFDAALVRGAGGIEAESDTLSEAEVEAEHEAEAELAAPDELQPPAPPGPPGRGGDGDGAGERPSGAPLRGGNRVIGFLRASWAELQRVQWPDRRQVAQATAVVLGFVAVAGLYLGLADFIAKEIVEYIL